MGLLSFCFLQEQYARLKTFEYYMLNMKFGSNYNKFQKGSILTIVSLVSLHKYLQRKFGLKYVMTSHIDQDYVESFIGSMRLSDGRGGVRKPTYLQLNYRIQRKILAFSNSINLFTLKIFQHRMIMFFIQTENVHKNLIIYPKISMF